MRWKRIIRWAAVPAILGAIVAASFTQEPLRGAAPPADPLPSDQRPGSGRDESGAARPRLVVIIVIDQFRADLLSRNVDLFLPPRQGAKVGGFRWLMETGTRHLDARHDHLPTSTGPGHAAISTGAYPSLSGIVANEWFDRATRKTINCVEDANSPWVIGEGKYGVSPELLRVTTIGDELKMATGGRAKVWGVGIKDRAAVLTTGRLADGAIWYDSRTGNFTTSRWYARSGSPRDWLTAWNSSRKADAYFTRPWTPVLAAETLGRAWSGENRHATDLLGLGRRFPHSPSGGRKAPDADYYWALIATPYGNELTLDAARTLVRAERLGQDETPDLLVVGLSANDVVGHLYGPDSQEALDLAVRTDRMLADFFNDLGQKVTGGLGAVAFVLTADHGVAPVVGDAIDRGLEAGTADDRAIKDAVETALDAAFGSATWVAWTRDLHLYLDERALARHKGKEARIEAVAARAAGKVKGVLAAFSRSRILDGRLPPTDLARRVALSYSRDRSGDIILIPEPQHILGGSLKGADHGSPHAYDVQVPLILAGAGFRPGVHAERVSTLDIAPTLAALLGVLRPSGSEGHVLGYALRAP